MEKIGFGGSCHWCTEAIFRSLKGVAEVLQGWIASENADSEFSEAVIVSFNPASISLETLIVMHLHSHSCTAEHTMRNKYRSAIYTFNKTQTETAKQTLAKLQTDFVQPIITRVIPFKDFKLNKAGYLDYYYSDPEKPFCQNYISPKLRALRQRLATSSLTQAPHPAVIRAGDCADLLRSLRLLRIMWLRHSRLLPGTGISGCSPGNVLCFVKIEQPDFRRRY